ncbi:MAG: histidine kinase [Saprospiraceae bacterium]
MKFFIVLLLFLLIGLPVIDAQNDGIDFYNLTEKDGLCDNIIFDLHKDRNNILWVGTQTGLSRFDGKNFYNFKQIGENGKFVSNTVSCLTSDKSGMLWGGTHNGVFSFNPHNGKFKVYYPNVQSKLNYFLNIFCSSNDEIYVSGVGSILRYNKKTDSFEKWKEYDKNDKLLNTYGVPKNKMLFDEENHCFWIGFTDGIGKWDYLNDIFTTNASESSNSLYKKRSVGGLTKSSDGQCWFFDHTNQKMISYDPCTSKETKIIGFEKTKPKLSVASSLVTCDGKIWLSDWNYNLRLIDQKNDNKSFDIKNSEKSNAIGSNFFWTSFEDENNSVWFGTLNGLSTYNSKAQIYKGKKVNKLISLLDTFMIQEIEENPKDNSWWILLSGPYLVQYFPSYHTFHEYPLKDFIPNHSNEVPSLVKKVYFQNNVVYILTDKGFWSQTDRNFNFKYAATVLDGINNFKPIGEYQAPYWYFYDNFKILKWNEITKEKKWILDPTFIDNGVGKIFHTSNGSFLGVTQKNYLIVHIDGQKSSTDSTIYKALYNQTGYLSDIEIDNNENIWFSCKGVGLGMYSLKTKKFKLWSDNDGMADKDLHQITLDKKGNVWGLYWNKVLIFNPNKNIFLNYKIPYSENKLDYSNFLTTRSDGVVMATVGNDIFEMSPENLYFSPEYIKPSFSSIRFADSIFFDTDKIIKLHHTENRLSINFGLMVDPASFPHTFEYILEGAESTWNHKTVASEITYSNLTPGSYKFRLRAVNKGNNWTSEERSLQFVISSPFYKQIWFVTLVIFSFGLALWYYLSTKMKVSEDLNALRIRAHNLEKEKAQMMFDNLKQQLNPHFLFNSLTSLSALINLDQSLASNFLSKMADMYRYILKNGDSETVLLKDELIFVETYYQLQKTRFGNGLILTVNVDDAFSMHLIAPVTLQNMMENAIKHNIIDIDSPLVINIFTEGEYLIVQNNSQPKKNVETSNKKGLEQLKTLYKYLTRKPVIIEDLDVYFIIKIPLIQNT